MSAQTGRPAHLPVGLTRTVGVVEDLLGQVVAEAEGRDTFQSVEDVRLDMVAFREAADAETREAALARAEGRLAGLSIEQKTRLARAYTLYLQLVNVCENAYRTHRLRAGEPRSAADTAQLTFVLTAHPTESRSSENIRLLRRIQDHVTQSLERGRPIEAREVKHLVRLAWDVGTHPEAKPSVEDEANHLFSLLTDPILTEVLTLAQTGHSVLFRTWVGGDKDGHPYVGPDQTEASLNRSRARLLSFIRAALLAPTLDDVELAGDETLRDAVGRVAAALSELDTVREGDGGRVATLARAIASMQSEYRTRFGMSHPAIERLETLLGVFPALVVPLELREERGRFGLDQPIVEMMRRVAAIAGDAPVGCYARALVVSMTLEAEDLLEAQRASTAVFGEGAPPVVPLFELPEVLVRAPDILADTWRDDAFRHAVLERGYVEVMLGYSDTAKRMGMLASRVALHDTMRKLGAWAESESVQILFFHGHGGSVGRGGGRFEDVVASWPPRARTPYKYTVQGEMVERTLATPEILSSFVGKVAEVQASSLEYQGVGDLTRELAEISQTVFADRVADPEFRRLLELATPYQRLQTLTIGSRPSKRGGGGFEELRAIPWVLCWTQTRLLLHAWLGVGRAWRAVRDRPDTFERLQDARADDPLFRSYARLLSFTLSKTELGIWRRYFRVLAEEVADEQHEEIEADFAAAVELACRAIDADSLLPDRPWLEESIRYRAPMIHPLNLLQIELLERPEWDDAEAALFRETVTGIAAGMLTTG